MITPEWRKSSYSDPQGVGDCVEVGSIEETTAVRDSKNRNGNTLAFDSDGWQRFLDSLR
jgi:hypothetical protein